MLVYDDQNMSEEKWAEFTKTVTETYEKINDVNVITVRVVAEKKPKSAKKTPRPKQK